MTGYALLILAISRGRGPDKSLESILSGTLGWGIQCPIRPLRVHKIVFIFDNTQAFVGGGASSSPP